MVPDFERILAPIDFSSTSTYAFEYATKLATRFGASIHLLHVVEDPVATSATWSEAYALDQSTLRDSLRQDAERELARLAASQPGLSTSAEIAVGNAAAAIKQVAIERKVDLIVMGTHGRTGVTHLLLGSVAEKVVRTAPCPVLTIREAIARATHAEPIESRGEPSQIGA